MFSVEKKITEAHFPRIKGSTISVNDRLKIVYNKFSTTNVIDNKIRINLVFSHGTGMNKEFWNYHIEKLYEYAQGQADWYLGSVISFDCASHGDSALVNNDKLGWTYGWFDGAKDLIKIVTHENETCNDFQNNRLSRNIIIGHSLGGHHVLMAGFLEPDLFDTIVPIEPVFYGDSKLFPVFVKRFGKISEIIMDEFDTLEDFRTYYEQFSFLKDMHPRVLKDCVDNEYYEVFDPVTQTTKYKSKANKACQMATYLSAYWALPRSQAIIPFIDTKICYVYGEKANWNPPGTDEFMIKSAKPTSLIEHHCVKDGTHLLNGELPDLTIGIIGNLIDKRARAASDNKDYYPEVIFNGDKAKIMEDRTKLLLQAKLDESVDFTKVKEMKSKF